LLNNRQAGRRRGRGGQRPQGSNNSGGRDTGNRIDNRARGNAPQMLEKYKTLARDAQMQGDRVLTEYYLQFADHYFRVVAETRARFEESRRQRDDWQEGDSEAYEGEEQAADEGGEYDAEDQAERDREQARRQPRSRDNAPRDNGNRDTGNRDNGNRESAGRDYNRESGNRDQGNRDPVGRDQVARDEGRDSYNGDRPPRRPRESVARDAAPRENNRNRDGNRAPREDREEEVAPTLDLAILPPALGVAMVPDNVIDTEEPIAPRRRGRPRKVEADVAEG
jgi:Domain of unknown function (DUF4167)